MTLQGLLVCEGSSDVPSGDIVQRLLLRRGNVAAVAPPSGDALRGPGLRGRVDHAMSLSGPVEFLVVHRDADDLDPAPGFVEMAAVAGHVAQPVVPVVPGRMTEARPSVRPRGTLADEVGSTCPPSARSKGALTPRCCSGICS